jgi:hypothetical protein
MKLSVCLMVCNEEANLPRALDSVRDVADEIVIIDTGSTDQTIPIAESYGARIIHCDWHEDYSTPHNVGWQHARGEWLLWLDGDESLLAASKPLVRECIGGEGIGGYYVLRQEIVDAAQPDRFTEMMMLRLHRRDIPAKWVGRYHNQIVPPLRGSPNYWVALPSEIRLQHWRQKSDPMLRARRSAKILAEELEAEPDNLYIMIELANSLSQLNDPRAAELRLRAAKMLRPTDPRAPTTPVVYVLQYLIDNPGEAVKANFSFDDVRGMCNKWFPRCAPLKWFVAQRLFAEQNYAEAAVELAEIARLVKTDDLEKIVPFDPRVGEDAQFNLGVCLTRLAMLDDAERIFRELSESPRRAEDARANLRTIAELRKLE